ncbi:MAG: hypothetical protein U0610_27135 [bacterium]
MNPLRRLGDRLLDLVLDRAIETAVALGHNRLPLGETDLSDHPDGEPVLIDPGDPEAQPSS